MNISIYTTRVHVITYLVEHDNSPNIDDPQVIFPAYSKGDGTMSVIMVALNLFLVHTRTFTYD